MAYGDWGGLSGGGGGSRFGGSRSGGARKGTVANPRRRDPHRDLTSSLVRLARTTRNLEGDTLERTIDAIVDNAQGLKRREYARIEAAAPEALRGYLRTKRDQASKSRDAIDVGLDAAGAVTGHVLNTISAPQRGVMSGIAEYSRQYEKQGRPVIPEGIDLGKVLQRAKEGAENKRVDTFSSISREAGMERAKRGESTRIFGVGPGDLRTNPVGGGKVGTFVADFGTAVATDPLTYLTFGLGSLAKAGIRGATQVIGAERTAEMVRKGTTVLTDAERAALAENLSPKVFEALDKGVRGGVKVRLPVNVAKRGRILEESGRTVIPGPLRGLRASKIIEGTGGLTDETRTLLQRARQGAAESRDRARQVELDADLAELQGAAPERVQSLRAEAARLDEESRLADDLVAEEAASVKQGATTAAERLRDTPVGRGLRNLREAPPVRTLRQLFIPREAVAARFGEGAAEALDAARVRYRGTYQSAVEDDVNELLRAARETGVTDDELENIIGPALDVGGAGKAAVPENLHPIVDALVNVRDRFTRAQQEAGVLAEEATHITDEYFPRVWTEQHAKLRQRHPQRTVVGGGPNPASRSGHLLKREDDLDKTVAEINEAAVAEGAPPKFEQNPLTAFSKRSAAANRDIATARFLDDVKQLTDESGQQLVFTHDELVDPELGRRVDLPEGYREVDLGRGGKVFAPKEIADEVEKTYKLIGGDEAQRALLRGIDKWMRLWKGYATVPLPFGLGFHERNAMGNVFLNWLADIQPTDPAYLRAMRIQKAMGKGRKQGDVLKFLRPEDRKLVEAAREHDIIGEGFFGVDLGETLDEAVRVPFSQSSEKGRRALRAANPLDPNNVLISTGRKVGSSIEHNARLAHFIRKIDDFGNVEDAARSVRKYLFDYADLTPFEQNVMKRFQAFYTFRRKALPVVLGSLATTPGKYSHLQAARTAIAAQAERPEGLYPSYLDELGGTPLPIGVSDALAKVPGLRFKEGEQVSAAPDLPFLNTFNSLQPYVQALAEVPGLRDLLRDVRNPEGTGGIARDLLSQEVAGGLPGAISTGIQAGVAEEDAFSGRPLRGRVAAPGYTRFLPTGVPIPGLSQERVLNGEMQPTITSKQQFIAESLIPILGKIGSMFPQGDYEQEKAPRRRLSMFTGQRVYPLGPGAQRGEALRRNELLYRLMAELREKGIDIASSRGGSSSSGRFGR